MDEAEKQNDLNVERLSLIDVSCEDDCLFSSPIIHLFPVNPKSSEKGDGQKSVQFLDVGDDKSADFLEDVGDDRETSELLKPEKWRKSEKYNLRKSLAWDSAFFTSDGVLDSEELSSIIGGTEKCEKHILPGIQEDINGSGDSTMTLESDALTLESLDLEADLFGDIRASIQKSSKASENANTSVKKEAGVSETETVSSSKKANPASQNKMKLEAAPRKHSVGMQISGKSLKQSVARTRESSSSLLKLPKGQSGVTPIPKTSSKKDSVGPRMEKDARSGNVVRAPGLKTPTVGGSRNITPRTSLHSRSSSYSSASTKAELTTSCSSLDSSGSSSSGSMTRYPPNLTKKKNDSGSSTIKKSLKIAARGKIQMGSSQLSALLKSATSPSSSISSASSISASESLSPVSAVCQRTSSTRTSIGADSCKGVSTYGDGAQAVGSFGGHVKIASAVTAGLAQPASIKTSGLRMPSPKIGFFDVVKSSGCSPNTLSHPGIPSSLPKNGAGTVNPSGSTNRANPGRPQMGRNSNRKSKLQN